MSMVNLKASIEAFRRHLRHIHYTHNVDLQGMIKGSPEAFIQFFRQLLTDHDPVITQDLIDKGFYFTGTTDQRLLELIYRYLREVAQQRPCLTLTQFLTNGFARHKIDLAASVVDCLNPASSSRQRSSSSALGSVRASPRGWRPLSRTLSASSSDQRIPIVDSSNSPPCFAGPFPILLPSDSRGDRKMLVDIDESPSSGGEHRPLYANKPFRLASEEDSMTRPPLPIHLTPVNSSSSTSVQTCQTRLQQIDSNHRSTSAENAVNKLSRQLTLLTGKVDNILCRLDRLEDAKYHPVEQMAIGNQLTLRSTDYHNNTSSSSHHRSSCINELAQPSTTVTVDSTPPPATHRLPPPAPGRSGRSTSAVALSSTPLLVLDCLGSCDDPSPITGSVADAEASGGDDYRVQVERIVSMLVERYLDV